MDIKKLRHEVEKARRTAALCLFGALSAFGLLVGYLLAPSSTDGVITPDDAARVASGFVGAILVAASLYYAVLTINLGQELNAALQTKQSDDNASPKPSFEVEA